LLLKSSSSGLEDGMLYRGQRYRSLSELARRITGTRWSGPCFFGLKPSRRRCGAVPSTPAKEAAKIRANENEMLKAEVPDRLAQLPPETRRPGGTEPCYWALFDVDQLRASRL